MRTLEMERRDKRGKFTGGPSYRFAGPLSGTKVGPFDIPSYSLARAFPLRYRLSLPSTCHQKFSRRRAVGSLSVRDVLV